MLNKDFFKSVLMVSNIPFPLCFFLSSSLSCQLRTNLWSMLSCNLILLRNFLPFSISIPELLRASNPDHSSCLYLILCNYRLILCILLTYLQERPVHRGLYEILRKESNLKCLILTCLICGCVSAIIWLVFVTYLYSKLNY